MNWMNQFAVAFSFILNLLYGKQNTNHLTCYDAYMSRNKTRNKIHQIPTNMCLGCSKTLTCLSSGKLKNYPDHSIYEVLCLSRLGWRMNLANIIFIVGKNGNINIYIYIYIYIYIHCVFSCFLFFPSKQPNMFSWIYHASVMRPVESRLVIFKSILIFKIMLIFNLSMALLGRIWAQVMKCAKRSNSYPLRLCLVGINFVLRWKEIGSWKNHHHIIQILLMNRGRRRLQIWIFRC